MASGTITDPSKGIKDITNEVNFSETVEGTNTCIYVKDKVLYVFFQGENKARANGDTLFALPSGYTTKHLIYIPCTVNATYLCELALTVGGVCSIRAVESGATGRLYASFSIPLQ